MTSSESENIVRRALSPYENRHAETAAGSFGIPDFSPLYEALAADAVLEIPSTSAPGEDDPRRTQPPWDLIGRSHRGIEAIRAAIEGDQEDVAGWEIQRPLEYFSSGDRVVVLLSERYSVRSSTTQVPWSEVAMVFDVRDGEIVRFQVIVDCSGHIAAHA